MKTAGGGPIVVERSSRHDCHFVWDFIRCDRNNSHAAEGDYWKSDSIIAREHQKSFGHSIDDLGDLRHAAAGFLHSDDVGALREACQRARLDICARAAWYVVEDDGFVSYCFSDGFEV